MVLKNTTGDEQALVVDGVRFIFSPFETRELPVGDVVVDAVFAEVKEAKKVKPKASKPKSSSKKK